MKNDELGVTPAERAERDGRSGLVLWFTGLSGAGKSTLARAVERQLWNRGYRTFLLDGDALRHDLCSDLGFDAADRHENVRRAAVVARLMSQAGLICLTALISPFRADRLRARNGMPPGAFVEVFVNAPLAVCEGRDTKSLYKRARSGELANFTGISSPYENPETPEIEVRTDVLTITESTALVLTALKNGGKLK
jgi:adenylyl-sulfate kinase